MIWQEFKDWMNGHEMTQAGFCRIVGTASNQVAIWRTKGHTPKWTSAYIALYDENLALKERLDPALPPPAPSEPLLLPDGSTETQLAEAHAEAPAYGDVELVELPNMTGSHVSRAEAIPMRRKIVAEQLSPSWWVRAFKG